MSTDMERISHEGIVRTLSMKHVWSDPLILYFGDWELVEPESGVDGEKGVEADEHTVGVAGVSCHRSNTQWSAFEFCFRGSSVRWIGTRGPDHGHADVYIDGVFQTNVDNYAETVKVGIVKFETPSVTGDRIHTLRVEVNKARNPKATDCFQDVTAVEAEEPVSYPAEISHAMHCELAQMRERTKPVRSPDSWRPVRPVTDSPKGDVTLGTGVLKDLVERNIKYLIRCFASPTYVDGVGWSNWLPASIEGRLLSGAANTLRWGERDDMRAIVNTIVDDIRKRMREDGYFNYYPDGNYALRYGRNAERKNYDRVFWTRGMIAAGAAGNPNAYTLLRRMYDWFNTSPNLPDMLFGGNATNGMPGGPLCYLSPAGTEQDLMTTMRYYEQEYWMNELVNRQPLAMSHYPGERAHCYELLGLEMFVDEYRATGDRRYLDAALGGWNVYRDNFKHIGGVTALMESHEVYPPKSYYFMNRYQMGETCGSVFWINVNRKLLQLFPTEERFTAEIEESVYNVIANIQDDQGNIRSRNFLHDHKAETRCIGHCCEVSSTDLIARLPEHIYSVTDDGIFVHLYASSEIQLDRGAKIRMYANFPHGRDVSLHVSVPLPADLHIRIRVPNWSARPIQFNINGLPEATGIPGSYQSLDRIWADGDTITFTLPMELQPIQYRGLEQLIGNVDRYALLAGPILLALVGDLEGPFGVPHLSFNPQELIASLTPVENEPLSFDITGYPNYRYVPYWKIDQETFTCFPAVQP